MRDERNLGKSTHNKDVYRCFWKLGSINQVTQAGAQDMSCVQPEGSLKLPHLRSSDEAEVDHMNPSNICHILFVHACLVNNSDKATSFLSKRRRKCNALISGMLASTLFL